MVEFRDGRRIVPAASLPAILKNVLHLERDDEVLPRAEAAAAPPLLNMFPPGAHLDIRRLVHTVWFDPIEPILVGAEEGRQGDGEL